MMWKGGNLDRGLAICVLCQHSSRVRRRCRDPENWFIFVLPMEEVSSLLPPDAPQGARELVEQMAAIFPDRPVLYLVNVMSTHHLPLGAPL